MQLAKAKPPGLQTNGLPKRAQPNTFGSFRQPFARGVLRLPRGVVKHWLLMEDTKSSGNTGFNTLNQTLNQAAWFVPLGRPTAGDPLTQHSHRLRGFRGLMETAFGELDLPILTSQQTKISSKPPKNGSALLLCCKHQVLLG